MDQRNKRVNTFHKICPLHEQVVLQNCMGLIKDEPDSGSEALDDGTEEGNMEVEEVYIKAEETLDVKEEYSERIACPTITAEPEVSVCAGV